MNSFKEKVPYWERAVATHLSESHVCECIIKA